VAATGAWTVQVATFGNDYDAERLHAHLQQLGYAAYTTGVSTSDGQRWRVFAGPVASKDAAEQLRDHLAEALHIKDMIVERR
jgi:DedD protein